MRPPEAAARRCGAPMRLSATGGEVDTSLTLLTLLTLLTMLTCAVSQIRLAWLFRMDTQRRGCQCEHAVSGFVVAADKKSHSTWERSPKAHRQVLCCRSGTLLFSLATHS